jgi:hypothetical protein
MTPSVFHFAFRDQRDGERRASVPGNNPAWEHMFHPVPDVENVQIPAIAGNKIRLEIEKKMAPSAGRDKTCQIGRQSPICRSILL